MPILPNTLQQSFPAALSLSSDAVAFVLDKRDLSDSLNPAKLFSQRQRFWIQVAVCFFSCWSMAAIMVAVYWFFKMAHKFRHKLIMLLLAGDLLRSVWLFVFTMVSLRDGVVQTTNPLCQASGYFLQIAYGMSDYAALFIAVHTALQIFKPIAFGVNSSETGLYRWRYAVYLLTGLVPITLSSLAFTRNGSAFIAQGPVCSLPLRPFWYRLALGWIPRYIIMLIIVILYVALYIHVGRQFGSLTILKKLGLAVGPPQAILFSTHNVFEMNTGTTQRPEESAHQEPRSAEASIRAVSMAFKTSNRSSIRKPSQGTTLVNGSTSTDSGKSAADSNLVPETDTIETLSLMAPAHCRDTEKAEDDHIKRQDHAPDAILRGDIHGPSPDTNLADWNADQGLENLSEPMLTREMRNKRHQAMRQLRLLFVYPVCYFICWLLPFALNLTNYSNYLVQHPPFVLGLLAYMSIAAFGLVSALVFSFREKPWRHTTGSDGTFWGSFCFWKHDSTRRTSANSYAEYGSNYDTPRGLSIFTPGGASVIRQQSTLAVPTLLHPSACTTGVTSETALRAPESAATSPMAMDERRVSDMHSWGMPSTALETPRPHEKYWFDVPSGRSSDDNIDEGEPGRSS